MIAAIPPDPEFRHRGLGYEAVIADLARLLEAGSYLEIGTAHGGSLAGVACDSLCIDPAFKIIQEVIGAKRRAFFFQMTSDRFFADHDVRTFFPGGVDIAFLDGLHRFEFLLRDFINVERACHRRSIILMHDCLPSNERMTERLYRRDESEPPETRGSWTGDAWRMLPILARHRPDLRILALDCPPTGLVACTRLDPASDVLDKAYHAIVDELAAVPLGAFGLERLWSTVPLLSSREVMRPEVVTSVFTVR